MTVPRVSPPLGAKVYNPSGAAVTMRPILFSGPMVRAILAGQKTQTRRVIHPRVYIELTETEELGSEPFGVVNQSDAGFAAAAMRYMRCPYGKPGDRLWVREAACIAPPDFGYHWDGNIRDDNGRSRTVQYVATDPDTEAARDYGVKVTPSIHMPRWASRIHLEVTQIRVERLQDISSADAMAEGAGSIITDPDHPLRDAAYARGESAEDPREGSGYQVFAGSQEAFAALWDSINAKRGHSWESNPWVWAVTFKRVEVAR